MSPIRFRKNKSQPVSCYAFIIGWLLPSPPPGYLKFTSSYVHFYFNLGP